MASTTQLRRAALAVAISCLSLGAAAPAQAAPDPNKVSQSLREGVTVNGMRQHLQAFQNIANAQASGEYGPTRASGTPGYTASVDYVAQRLRRAGLRTRIQSFPFEFYRETGPSSFARTAPTPTTFVVGEDYEVMDYSGSGTVTDAAVQPVDLSIADPAASTSGCEEADFAGFTAGNVALVQRGGCPFGQKVTNAEAAGAGGAIVFNQGNGGPDRTDLFEGTLGTGVGIPAVSVSFPRGGELAQAGTRVSITTQTESDIRQTQNVIADLDPKNARKAGKVIVVGAHLDSVVDGPGINDNGSGSAFVLEAAEEMAERKAPANPVRFAFWGAEESNLVGSTYYVDTLPPAELAKIGMNLNFDMLGSPNFARLVYDGDGGGDPDAAGPEGSAQIEQVFTSYFASQGLATLPTPFDGRSDYGPFIAVGIPAGGLFSGAEGIKTADEVALFGGTAGEAYDRCYHQACDTISNINYTGLDQLADGAAHALAVYAYAKAPPAKKGKKQDMDAATFRGSHAQR